MADLGDVLRHVVSFLPGLSETNRAEFTDAVNGVYPPPEPPEPEPVAETPDPAAEIASLKAQLAEAQKAAGTGQAAPAG